jgi:hypothetical protein
MDEDKKKSRGELRAKVREQTVGYISAALGLVAGLAWNDAVKALIERIYPAAQGGGVVAKFWYAGLVTIAIVVISYYLIRFAAPKDPKD